MQHPYIPQTDQDQKEMLDTIGVDSIKDLFKDVPEEVSLDGHLDLPEAKSELEVMNYLSGLAKMNTSTSELTSFRGVGSYDHYIPTVVGHITGRSEFYTSYTPYQPEVSQGTLQYIFEFQSFITRLTGLPIANASLYDNGYSIAEAGVMCANTFRKDKVVVSETVSPTAREVLKTYCHNLGIEVVEAPIKDGHTDMEALEKLVDDKASCIIAQSPNFFGHLEDVEKMTELAHSVKKCGMVLSTDLGSLSILRKPSEYGVDVVVGDIQAMGMPMSFGGPTCGFMATTDKFLRKFPGRIVGQTEDTKGKRGWVLTLNTREQHIRREKATSNICSNQGLNVLASTVYMSLMGDKGLKEVASQSTKKAHYAYNKLIETGNFEPFSDRPFYKEFALKSKKPVDEINCKLKEAGILGGFEAKRLYKDLDDVIIIAVTEKRTKEEIDKLVEIMGEA